MQLNVGLCCSPFFVLCVAGGADEVSHVDVIALFLEMLCSPLRQCSGLIKALTGLRLTFLWWAYSLKSSEVCLSQLPLLDLRRELSLYFIMLWTELSLDFSQPCKKRKRNCKWQWVNIYKWVITWPKTVTLGLRYVGKLIYCKWQSCIS